MKNAIPESHDYKFTHNGTEYAIGYQSGDDVLALSKKSGNDWNWETIVQGVNERLNADESSSIHKTVDELINEFIVDVNNILPEDDGLPANVEGKLKELLLIIKNGLHYSGGRLERI